MEGIDLLQNAVEAFERLDPDALTDDELGDTLIAWHHLEARLSAHKARYTAVFDQRGAYRADGSRSAAGWLASKANCSLGEMRAQTRLARRLQHMPATRAALAAGLISERHAHVLARLAGSPRAPVAERFGEAEAMLVDYAQTLGFDEFVTATRYWETVVDEDGVEDQAAADHASRHLHLSQILRGNWRLDGQLDAAAGTEINAELSRLERQLFEEDWAAAQAIHGDATCGEHLARTGRQRRADALREMAYRSRSTSPGTQRPRPLLVVHLGDDSLKRLCELANGTPLAPGQLVPLLTDADIERIVYAGPSRKVIDLGRRTRFFTGALRRAIQLRDRRCTEGGCHVPADDCHIDHNIPWSKGGRTDQNNGEARCAHANHHKADTITPTYLTHRTEPGWHHTDPDTHYPDEPDWPTAPNHPPPANTHPTDHGRADEPEPSSGRHTGPADGDEADLPEPTGDRPDVPEPTGASRTGHPEPNGASGIHESGPAGAARAAGPARTSARLAEEPEPSGAGRTDHAAPSVGGGAAGCGPSGGRGDEPEHGRLLAVP